MRLLFTFMAAAIGGIILVLLALWAANGFADLGLDTNGAIALGIGIVLTSGLGVGLMSLIFFSDRLEKEAATKSRRKQEIGGRRIPGAPR